MNNTVPQRSLSVALATTAVLIVFFISQLADFSTASWIVLGLTGLIVVALTMFVIPLKKSGRQRLRATMEYDRLLSEWDSMGGRHLEDEASKAHARALANFDASKDRPLDELKAAVEALKSEQASLKTPV